MGRGSRATVRWKHERIKKKKARDKRPRYIAPVVAAPEATAAAPPPPPPPPPQQPSAPTEGPIAEAPAAADEATAPTQTSAPVAEPETTTEA
jgi:hypothetical protein